MSLIARKIGRSPPTSSTLSKLLLSSSVIIITVEIIERKTKLSAAYAQKSATKGQCRQRRSSSKERKMDDLVQEN